MLKSVTIENFFSFGEKTTIKLNPQVNVLLGINGSGKTNFLRAIRLLYESVAGEGFERLFTEKWGGFQGVANFSDQQKGFIRLLFEFDQTIVADATPQPHHVFRENPCYEITVRPLGTTGYFLEERAYSGEFNYLMIRNGKGKISMRDPEIGKIRLKEESELNIGEGNDPISFKTTELVLRQFEDPVRFLPLFKLKRAIESMAIYDSFNTSPSSPVRLPTQAVSTTRLNPDGSNLTPLLNSLENRNAIAYEQLIQQLGRINPNFRDISISNQGSYQHLALRERNLARSVQSEHISDGTLRYLMLSAIALNPERGRILGVDEPENGLHPDMLNTVTTALKDAANNHTQLIVATHSPLVINAFEPEDVLVFDKTANNATSVKTLDDEELENYFDQYTLGQLWLMGKIGAKRW